MISASSLATFSLRIGAGVPEPISSELRRFYEWLGKEASPHLPPPEIPDSTPTACVTLEDLVASPSLVGNSLRQFLVSLPKDRLPSAVLVHLFAPPDIVIPAATERELFHAIHDSVLSDDFAGVRFLLPRREIPPPNDIFRRGLQDIADKGLVTLFAEDGARWPLAKAEEGPDPAAYRFWVRRLNADPSERIERRLCRVRGHFKRRIRDVDLCTRFLYDASRCVREIASEIVRLCGPRLEKTDLILVDVTISDWLTDVGALLTETTKIRSLPLSFVLDAGVRPLAEEVARSLLLVPVVDSGHTLTANLSSLQDLYGVWPGWALAVMVTSNWPGLAGASPPTQDQPGLAEISHEGKAFGVEFLLTVNRGLQASSECRLCQGDLVPSQNLSAIRDIRTLRSFFFWEMVGDAGFKANEPNPPPWRAPLPGAPNIPEMLSGPDGAWLAAQLLHKLRAEAWREVDATSLLLVAPDQTGARLFAQRLVDLEPSSQAIYIPDEIVKRFRDNPTEQLGLKDRDAPWCGSLLAASLHSRPIVCEEFTVSGGTAVAIRRILASCGKPPAAHLAVVDFRAAALREAQGLKCVSLYAFDFSPVAGLRDRLAADVGA